MNRNVIPVGFVLALAVALGAGLPIDAAQAEKSRVSQGAPGGQGSGEPSAGQGSHGRRDSQGSRGSQGSDGNRGARGDPGSRGSDRSYDSGRGRYDDRRYHDRRYDRRYDGRYDRRHDGRYDRRHDYPSRGHYVHTLPARHVVVHHHRDRYYYGHGVWYRPYGHRYRVVYPPVGLYVSVLPEFTTTLWFGGYPYYYANDVYYAWRPSRRVYEVVDPPEGRDDAIAADDPEDVYVYPREGQSEEQQNRDRFECHRWAVDQAGFDPSAAGGGVERDQRADKRDDYSRALAACLDGRGYTVR
jgi:hypothetical protein